MKQGWDEYFQDLLQLLGYEQHSHETERLLVIGFAFSTGALCKPRGQSISEAFKFSNLVIINQLFNVYTEPLGYDRHPSREAQFYILEEEMVMFFRLSV